MPHNSSKSLSKTEESHLKLIKQYTSNIEKLSNNDVGQLLRTIKTRKNQTPSDNYLISILRTIKKCNENITKKPNQLQLQVQRHTDDDESSFAVKKAVTYVIKEIYTISQTTINSIDLRSTLDAFIAILLITSTTISIHTIYDLTTRDLKGLIETKSIVKDRKILTNKLFTLAAPIIEDLITRRNSLDIDNVHFNVNFVISCVPNIINKTIKKMCEEAAVTFHLEASALKSLGLNKFRFKNPNFIYKIVTSS